MRETIEEAAENNYPDGDDWTIAQAVIRRLAFKNGAKSDAARDYWFEKFQKQGRNKFSEEEVKLLIDFVKTLVATNWDCDNDSHKYNTPRRMCEAEKVLEQFKKSKK